MFVFVLLCITLCPSPSRGRESWLLCYYCLTDVFLTVPLVGLQCVIVVFPDHTHLLFNSFEPVMLSPDWQLLDYGLVSYRIWIEISFSYKDCLLFQNHIYEENKHPF